MKANEQFLQRDFNPQDKQPMTAYGQALPFASVVDKAATIAKIGLYRAHTQSAPSMSALKREFRLSVSRVTASRTAGKRRMVTRKPSELTLWASVLRHNGRID